MRKKKILLTFSKSRNRKLYSYTFNIYGAYRLLRYKAMIFYKCSSQDGTVNGLTGSHPGVAGRGQPVLPSAQYHVNRTG